MALAGRQTLIKLSADHPWSLTPTEAIALQKRLASQVISEGRLEQPRYVAGVDVGFEDNNRITRAAVAVLSYPQLDLVDQGIARRPTCFPYIPGLLSFREIPAILDALARLSIEPEVLLCDGQGLAHPRRLGIACHLGLITGLTSIGVGKTRLVGRYEEPGPEKGDWSPLLDKGECIGAVLRSRSGIKPIYISIGHRIDLSSAIELVMGCVTRYKLPETTRWAHRLASGLG